MMRHKLEHNPIEYLLALLDSENGGAKKPDEQYLDVARNIRHFIDEIPGGFLIYRADGNEEILYANSALIRIFKCDTVKEFMSVTGGSFKTLVHPDDIDAVEASIGQQIAASEDDLDYVEYRIIDKFGSVRWVEDYGHFVHTKTSGDAFYVFITDATEKISRRMSEKAALLSANRRDKEKLQNIIEEYDKERKLIRQEHLRRLEVIEGLSINYDSILYAVLDPDTVLPYRYSHRLETQFDQKFQQRKFSAFLEEYAASHVHPDDKAYFLRELSVDNIRKKLRSSPTFYVNYRTGETDGTQYLQLRVVNVGSEDRISQIVLGCRNVDEEVIEEIKKKQLLADALEKARTADVAKNTFLSNMSHDMRTPLNAIFGYTALARRAAKDNEAAQSCLDKIDTAGKQILELVEKVLQLSYLETQNASIIEESTDLGELMNEVYAATKEQAKDKDIRVVSKVDTEHPCVVCDREKLKQLLLHLTNNAVKYTDSGKVVVSLEEKTGSDAELSTFIFTVKDTGIGISEAALTRIFEPFEREKNTTHSGVYGLGIGLTIVRHLAEAMGGTVRAESSQAKGSTFTVTLTFRIDSAAESRAAGDPKASLIDSLNGRKILIVEDNELNLEIESELLSGLGIEADSAPDGKAAVDKLLGARPNEYALVLMDIQMPIMDGRAAAREIRSFKDRSLASIPIVALSANAFESDRRESLEAGMDAHLPKPLDLELLIRTASDLLSARGRGK